MPPFLKRASIAAAVVAALLLAALLGAAALVDAGHGHQSIQRFVEARTHRPIRIDGSVQTRLLSLHPSFTAEDVVIGNPPWVPAGTLARIGRLEVEFELPTFSSLITIRRLELRAAQVNLLREASGAANWRSRSGRLPGKGAPLIHDLLVRDADVTLHDARRHLDFKGKLSMLGHPGDKPLRVVATGELNAKAMTLELQGDPLALARRDKRYGFSVEQVSNGSRLTGKGFIERPFDLRRLQVALTADGADLADLYYLVGLRLPDTGKYHAQGALYRDGMHFDYRDLRITTGSSDLGGTLQVDSQADRPRLTGTLHSQRLRLADLGKAAAQRKPPRRPGDPALSTAPLRLTSLRRTDARVGYTADRVDVGPLQLNSFDARFTVEAGKLAAAPIAARFDAGKLRASLRFDGSRDVPSGEFDLAFDGLALARLDAGKPGNAPFAGLLQGQVAMRGQGKSLHALAAGASGSLEAVLPDGQMRGSLAELPGLNLRSLGLVAAGNTDRLPVRCGVARLQVQDGKVMLQQVLIDSETSVITATGSVDLATEALDLRIEGQPKQFRLRVRSPVLVSGTLGKPSIGVDKSRSIAQATAGIALGALLTPAAALVALADVGTAKDTDCGALLAPEIKH